MGLVDGATDLQKGIHGIVDRHLRLELTHARGHRDSLKELVSSRTSHIQKMATKNTTNDMNERSCNELI